MSTYMAVRLRIRQYPILSSIVCVKCREQAFTVTEWVKVFCRSCGMVELRSSFSLEGLKTSWDLRLLPLRISRLWNLMLTPCSFVDRYQRVEINLPTGLWKQQARWELYLSTDLHGVTSSCNLGVQFLLVNVFLSHEIRFCTVKIWIPVFWIVTAYIIVW